MIIMINHFDKSYFSFIIAGKVQHILGKLFEKRCLLTAPYFFIDFSRTEKVFNEIL
jgi:hypothetical protein